jgi:hypothetical protein
VAHKFAEGKKAFAYCDRCSFRTPLRNLKRIQIKDTLTEIRVCASCWEESQPQLQQGKYPVFDPVALRNPRPDISYFQSGLNVNGYPGSGSRIYQWGFSPVGGAAQFDTVLTPNSLIGVASVGSIVWDIAIAWEDGILFGDLLTESGEVMDIN